VGQERTAEEVLCNLVFELNNLRSARNFEIIEHLSRCGEITRSAFIYDMRRKSILLSGEPRISILTYG
jgi:hypothetical protein